MTTHRHRLPALGRALLVAGGIGLGLVSAAAVAQDISESHLAAARAAVTSARTAEGFNNVLPALAEQVQTTLIAQRPDLHKEITAAVDAMALSLAVRRGDLDNDVARIWAKAFSEEELLAITAFYKSPAGTKLAEIGSQVLQDSLQVVQGWSQRVGEELLEKSREELKRQGIDF